MSSLNISSKDARYVNFVTKSDNLTVHGDMSLPVCVKLCRWKIIGHLSINLKMFACNSLYATKNLDCNEIDDLDVVCITGIYDSGTDYKNRSLCGFIEYAIMKNKQVLLGARSVDDLTDALETSWDIIDATFLVKKIG